MTFGNYTTTVVATVDQNGKVTAVSNGTANITVTTQDVFVQNVDQLYGEKNILKEVKYSPLKVFRGIQLFASIPIYTREEKK